MEDIEDFCLSISDSRLRNISKNVELNFPICKFYEMLLREYLKDNQLQITSYFFIPNNYETMYLPATSIIKRYNLEGEHNGVQDFERYIVVKLRNEDPRYIKYGVGILHENEMLAYEKIFPLLSRKEFCSERLPIPEVYFASKNAIIMEDLNQNSFYFPDKNIKGITAHQCRSVLKHLAKFHARSLVVKMKAPEKFQEVQGVTREVLFFYKQSEILEFKRLFFDKLIEIFEKQQHFTYELESAIETLKSLRKTFVAQIKNLILYPGKHSVFCHGDLRASNIFINSVTGMIKFIDFQQICYSSIARDLVTLFYVNLQPRDMRNFMSSFLLNYLKHLHVYLKEQDVDLEYELTEKWLNNEMMKFQVYGIVYGLWHSVEFYIENTVDGMSIEKLCKQKYGDTNLGSDFIARAISMLAFYKNQTASAVGG